LKKKGIEFPEAGASGNVQEPVHDVDKAGASTEAYYKPKEPKYRKPAAAKKDPSKLSSKLQKVLQEMNLLKGNINFTNEIMDTCKSKGDMQ